MSWERRRRGQLIKLFLFWALNFTGSTWTQNVREMCAGNMETYEKGRVSMQKIREWYTHMIKNKRGGVCNTDEDMRNSYAQNVA